MGKLLAIEGLDASGKATQSALLCEYLEREGVSYQKVSFPNYQSESSALVRMYLSGQLGGVEEIGAYAASAFFAVDRYASFRQGWKAAYDRGTVIVADRYTTSNASHQTSKLPRDQWEAYLDWLEDFEYGKLGLPRPDGVIFLDMHPHTSRKLLLARYGGDASREDIHEADYDYLLRCRQAAHYVARRQGWTVIRCCDGENPFPVEEIARQVREAALAIIRGEVTNRK